MDSDTGWRDLIRDAYEGLADERAAKARFEYREHLLFEFLDLLHAEGRSELVEFGAGAGQDAMVFHDAGLDILATDFAPAHVEHCRRRGLLAMLADLYDLPFSDDRWPAAIAMSCLIHVPDRDIDHVLSEVQRVLMPGAPFGVGTWVGEEDLGEWTELEPPHRFFSIRSDESVRTILGRHFTVERFDTTALEDGRTYQWTVVRKT